MPEMEGESMALREFVYLGQRLVAAESAGTQVKAYAYGILIEDSAFKIFYTPEPIAPLPVGAVFQAWATLNHPPAIEDSMEDGGVFQYAMFGDKPKRDEWLFQDIMAEVQDNATKAVLLQDAISGAESVKSLLHPLRRLVKHESMTPTLRRAIIASVLDFLME